MGKYLSYSVHQHELLVKKKRKVSIGVLIMQVGISVPSLTIPA